MIKIQLVDDEPNILNALKRLLHPMIGKSIPMTMWKRHWVVYWSTSMQSSFPTTRCLQLTE